MRAEPAWGKRMRRIAKFSIGIAIVGILVLVPIPGEAILDDFEQDFWLAFTHFNLGGRASAGYSDGTARSGDRSYRVSIQGWATRDSGSAYGYALFATSGAALARMRVSILHAALADGVASPWDGFLAGISLQLLDPGYRALGMFRYVTAYRASLNAGRCGPTVGDIVLGQAPTHGIWQDVGRNPAADFPAAPWGAAAFVKVSIGFLCAAGLTGADYRLHFDDFALDADEGDRDGDGIDDLEEDARRFVTEIVHMGGPIPIPSGGNATVVIAGPIVSGLDRQVLMRLELEHPRPMDLSVVLELGDDAGASAHLLWDPGFHERGIAILQPAPGASLHGEVLVIGRMPTSAGGAVVDILLDGVPLATGLPVRDGAILFSWNSEDSTEGAHLLVVEAAEFPGTRAEVPVIVDRTAPELVIVAPTNDVVLSGLAIIEAHAFDALAVDTVELWIDDVRMDVRHNEPYTFPYETADLANDAHRIELRARDPTGNEAVGVVRVVVNNDAPQVVPPCLPACNLSSGTEIGNLPLPSAPGPAKVARLPGGDRVESTEMFRVAWIPGVFETPGGVMLALELLRPEGLSEMDGIVAPDLTSADLASVRTWRIVVADHGTGGAGTAASASVAVATRLSSSVPDTDGDGIPDGIERASASTSPVLLDGDADGLPDPFELEPHDIEVIVDGIPRLQRILTDPTDGDTDRDGLSDGDELLSKPGTTDPTDADTDDDGLTDGSERNVHGSDPTLRNTDGDGFDDGYEVRPRAFALTVNGEPRGWELTTSPSLADTDDDRLTDDEEERGLNPTRVVTHPGLADTDEDGLNDSEELRIGVDGFETRALHVDSDVDGVWDTFDKLPWDDAAVTWTTEYAPGLVRFDQEIRVFWLEGQKATTTRRTANFETNQFECVIISDDKAGSTKTSVVTDGGIVGTMNAMFVQAGETRYEATRTSKVAGAIDAFGLYAERIGSCPEDGNEYYLEYRIHEAAYGTSFVNVETVTIEDESDHSFAYGLVPLPVDLGRTFSVILQFSMDPADDRSYFDDYDSWLAPAFTYVVFGGPDAATSSILHSGTTFATELNEFAYRVELRIPGTIINQTTVTSVDSVPMISLYFSPLWVGRTFGRMVREALNPAALDMASISTDRPEQVYSFIVRLEREDQDFLVSQADTLIERPTGSYTLGNARVYVLHENEKSEVTAAILEVADAVLIVADSESDLFAARESIDWGDSGIWYQSVQDPWGQAVKAFRDSLRIIRTTVVVAQFAELLRYRYAPPGSYVVQANADYLILIEKGEIDGVAVYVVSVAESEQEFLFELAASGEIVVRRQLAYRVTNSEITTDLTASKVVTARYAAIKSALRGLGVGAVVATNGREAVVGFQQGDLLKGFVYSTNAAIGVLGILRGEVSLATLFGLRSSKLRAVRLGSVATAASGALIAGFELHSGLSAVDGISRQAHFERAAVSGIDTGISIVPIYGSAILLSWSLTSASLSLIMPNPIAARITSSPGAIAVFLFEYFLTGAIPSAVAESVLTNAIDAMLLLVNIDVVTGIPTVPILP